MQVVVFVIAVLNDQFVLWLSDTVGLISHLCTILNRWVKEETEASQSRILPMGVQICPRPLINRPSTMAHMFLSHCMCMFTYVNTISLFLIYSAFCLFTFLHTAAHCLFFLQYLKLSLSLCMFLVHTQALMGYC